MTSTTSKPMQKRIGKELWLRTALATIARDGDQKVRIDSMAKELGVTKGSFYHHFRDRQDFIDQVVDFWVDRFNRYVIETIEKFEGPSEARLLSLMKLVKREGLDLYDITFRAWAAQDEHIAQKVREVDLARYEFIHGLFADMGFSGEELETRTRIWLVFSAANSTVHFPASGDNETDPVTTTHAFFVNR